MEFSTGNGLVSIDGEDIASVLCGCKRFFFFIEDGHDTNRIAKKTRGANGLLIGIHDPKNISIQECTKIVESLSKHVKKSANVIWGVDITGKKRLLVVAAW